MKNFPQHIAIIPDGNRRWAKKNGLTAIMGHEKGSEAIEKILDKTLEFKIPYITFWGLSLDNILKRSKTEVLHIYKILENEFEKLIKDERLYKEKIKVQVFGRWQEMLPQKTKQLINSAIEKTKNYNKYYLTFLLAYDGTDEMIDCIRQIQKQHKKADEKLIRENLWTGSLPDVDLLIRTGVENDPHLSAGFMMWHTAYSQLYFTKTYFPAFSPKEFEKSIFDYADRQRRKGA